jgi:hypothetical protein
LCACSCKLGFGVPSDGMKWVVVSTILHFGGLWTSVQQEFEDVAWDVIVTR